MPSYESRWTKRALVASVVGCSIAIAASADAQPAPGPTGAPTTPTTPAGAAPTTVPDVARAAGTQDASAATAAVPGGITADQVASRAVATSYQAKTAQENLNSASARADSAQVGWVPRVGLKASYTRLSDFTPPSIGGSGSLVGTPANAGLVTTPSPGSGPNGPFLVTSPLAASGSLAFPLVLDNYLLQATVAIPISDYFLRVSQAYTAATHAEDAARWDLVAARAASYANGKIAYFTWLRARGALVVAEQSRDVAAAHLKDAQNQFAVGSASRADVLRAETQVAAADLGVERAKSGVVTTERQVRIAIHAQDEEVLQPGESIDGSLPPQPTSLKGLVAEAVAQRPEIKSIDKNAESARRSAEVARAGKYPVLSGFGDVTYANPNPRRFPATQDWFPTWSAGAQITWTPNDFLVAGPGAMDAESRAAAFDGQKGSVRDGIDLEVTQAYQSVLEADTSVGTTKRELDSALEGYRVARELFNAGRGTSTTLIDAENALTQARFDHLNARVDARIARIRLDHALGRDAHAQAVTPP